MLLDAQLGLEFCDAAVTAAFLPNLSPVTGKSCTPWELIVNKEPDLSPLKVFGCRAYVKKEKQFVNTIGAQSLPGIFLGYEPTSKAYRVLVNGRVQISRNVNFIEHKFGLPKAGEARDPCVLHELPEEDDDLDDEFIERFIGPVEDAEDILPPPGNEGGLVYGQADSESYTLGSGDEDYEGQVQELSSADSGEAVPHVADVLGVRLETSSR
jgi:hypothetical protein